MILSNVELFAELDAGRLIIKPEPAPRLPEVGQAHSPFDTHSVDLRLGDEITVPKAGQFSYDLTKPGSIAETIRQHSETIKITEWQPFTLEPGRFVLARTHEHIELPILPEHATCLAVRIEGKSSRAVSASSFTSPLPRCTRAFAVR